MTGFGGAALGTILVAMDLIVVCLRVVYLNSSQVQTSSRNVIAVAIDLLGVQPTR